MYEDLLNKRRVVLDLPGAIANIRRQGTPGRVFGFEHGLESGTKAALCERFRLEEGLDRAGPAYRSDAPDTPLPIPRARVPARVHAAHLAALGRPGRAPGRGGHRLRHAGPTRQGRTVRAGDPRYLRRAAGSRWASATGWPIRSPWTTIWLSLRRPGPFPKAEGDTKVAR